MSEINYCQNDTTTAIKLKFKTREVPEANEVGDERPAHVCSENHAHTLNLCICVCFVCVCLVCV